MPAVDGLTVELAGRAIRFVAADPAWLAALRPRYGAFRTDRAAALTIELEASEPPVAGDRLARLAAEPVELRLENGRLELRSRSIAGRIEPELGRGRIAAPVHRHAVDVAVRGLLAATAENGLLVHGALLIDGSEAHVCAGPSGAGKTTLAALLGARAHCDELTWLERDGDGWRAAALPFWHGRPGAARLAKVHLLRHAAQHAWRRLPESEALARLATEIVWPSFWPPAAARALELLERLLAEVPVGELGFRPSADVWPVLAGRAA